MTAFLIDAEELRNCTVLEYNGLDGWSGTIVAAQVRYASETHRTDFDELLLVVSPIAGGTTPLIVGVNRHLFEEVAERQPPRVVNLVAAVAMGAAVQG